ncbi:GAF and ANTAR domain-containing protein [Kribbella yunnanensis]|uniref:GAF and ANTAR domain-containing protein n=1 Tax=Kribbella yunnanensis TaxID=190194 RepID=A0ABN2J6L1_9ACTN
MDPQSRDAVESFAQLALKLYDADGVIDTAGTVADFAVEAVGCSFSGIALAAHDGPFEIGAATAPVVETLYQVQADSGEGPVLSALAERSAVVDHDSVSKSEWPRFRKEAAELGIGSDLHLPITYQERAIGVLSLYYTEPDAYGDDDETAAAILAQHAGVAVATAVHDQTITQTVESRRLIGQAAGILMERFGIDSDRAFAILQHCSQDTNTKLRAVAQDLIDTRNLPGTRPHPPQSVAVSNYSRPPRKS